MFRNLSRNTAPSENTPPSSVPAALLANGKGQALHLFWGLDFERVDVFWAFSVMVKPLKMGQALLQNLGDFNIASNISLTSVG